MGPFRTAPVTVKVMMMILGTLAFFSSAVAFAADAPKALVNYQLSQVAEGLNHPWSIAFLPNGDMLVTERSGTLRIIRDGKLDPTPISGTPPVYHAGQGGMLDVVLHPDFARNNVIFLSYAHGTASNNGLRVARAVLADGALENLDVIYTTDPLKNTPVHYGGRMVFIKDGTLLVTTGDGFDFREQAQKLGSLLGKVVRINEDGSVPADNPFQGQADANPKIWTYGHRNPQGLIYDAENDIVYLHEHGPRGGDEINILRKGLNYGWPIATYGIDYSGAMISPFTEYEGTEQPLLYWVPSIAPSGFTIYTGDLFPEWKGDLFAGALALRHVRRVNMENGKEVGQEELFSELDARIRDIRTAPDGSLILLIDDDDGLVLRVTPKP